MYNTFTAVFLIMLAIGSIIGFWLGRRHIHHILKHRAQVPAAFADKIPLADHQKAADYSATKTRFGQIDQAVGLIVLLAWTLGGGLNALDQGLRHWIDTPADNQALLGLAVIGAFLLISSLIDLPFELHRTFKIEARFGFNHTTLGTFIGDKIKGLMLAALIGLPLLWAILKLMQSAGDHWWLWAWALWTGFSLLLMWAFPVFIAPLFNKFTPLDKPELRQRIDALLQRCGFKSNGIYIMDGSKRSAHGNAYFTGFGNNKRIVFFDTLLDSLEPEEIEAVLAHELGHFKHKHIRKHLIITSVLSLLALYAIASLMQQPWFYQGLGVSQPSTYMALLLFILAAPAFTFWVGPLSALLSRKHEFQADDYARQQTSAQRLIDALVKLYQENANTLTPDPLYSAFHDSHPPAPVRIAHLQRS